MDNLFPYLAKASLILAFFYAIYWFFLRKETYIEYMRFYLVSCVIISFAIPLISINLNTPNIQESNSVRSISAVQEYLKVDEQIKDNYYILENPALMIVASEGVSYLKIISSLYLTGVAVFFLLFFISLVNIFRLITKHKIIKTNQYNLILIDRTIAPFSFLNYIILNKNDFTEKDYKNIIEHETVHIQQKHSIDVILVELFKIILWFNPVIWLLKSSLKSVHEYLADKNALKNGCDIVEYQTSVLTQFINPRSILLTNSFNVNSIKNRLSMMTKNQHSKWAKAKISATLFLTAGIIVLLTCNFVTNNDKVALYYKNGNKKFEAEIKNDKLNGAFTCWDSLKQITCSGNFNENGYLDGIVSSYTDGIKRAEYLYHNDTLQYLSSSWYVNGQLSERFIKGPDNTTPKLLRYFESGSNYEEIEYNYQTKDKSKFIVWNENGEIAFSGYYKENLLYADNSILPFSGSISALFKNGQKAREGSFKNGVPIGIESEWYQNKNKRTEINHISNTKNKKNNWVARTDIKNWETNGQESLSGNLSYEGSGFEFFMPFSIERESFLMHFGHTFGGMINSLREELSK